MRVLVFFDLPVITAENRRAYVKFRKFLLKNGFLMLQESVYCKLALNGTAVNAIVDNVHKNKPEEGLIQLLTVTEKQYSKVEASHLLLIDSGGQYLTGTTDITRTFVLGEMTPEERKDFTIALKAMFRLQNAHFIQDVTTGANLDILARGVIYDYDLDYRCGTGHGVGHFLNVHEGPNGLRPKSLYGHEACIVPGMITTDEPGVYVEGSHGIRHENELLCVKHTENEYGTFLKFEPITYVPFDIEGLDLNYLSNHEIASINEYQQYAFDHIKDALTQEEKDWYLNNLFIK